MQTEKNKTALSNGVKPDAGNTQHPAAVPETAAQASRRNRRRKLTGIMLVFFLLAVMLFIVPVRFIPGLRYLAARIGWSEQLDPSFSFARALLNWKMDDANRLLAEGEGYSMFNQPPARGIGETGAKSSLFNLKQVNAARRTQGLAEDRIAGVYNGPEEENSPALKRPAGDWSREAQRAAAEREKRADVFLGEDISVAERAAAQGADRMKGAANSIRLLPKVGLKPAGSGSRGSSDWLGQLTDKASLQRLKDLDETTAKLQRGNASGLSVLGGGFSEKDAQRELSAIWILSDAADKKAKQPMLKKQLASAGYMAIEMPKKVFDSFGFSSGVRMDGNELVMNFETEEERLKKEEECRELVTTTNDSLVEFFNEAHQVVNSMGSSLPTSCSDNLTEKVNTFKELVQRATVACKDQKEVIAPLDKCGIKTSSEKGTCETELPQRAEEIVSACAAWEAKKKECEAIEAAGDVCSDELKAEIQAAETARDTALGNLTQEDVNQTFNIGENSRGGDFFPESNPFSFFD